MSDAVLAAGIRRARDILADYLADPHANKDKAINALLGALDNAQMARAVGEGPPPLPQRDRRWIDYRYR